MAIKKYTHLYRDVIDSKRILREICILRQLDHPNIVKLYDIIIPNRETVSSIYLVMELLDTDLRNILHNPKVKFNEDQVRKIMFDILEGIRYLHKYGILHRDLKPANIILNINKCQAKICDFGLARDTTLEYETDHLLKIFFDKKNPFIDDSLDYEYIKDCLTNNKEIHPDLQAVIQNNIEFISNQLFKKFSQFILKEEKSYENSKKQLATNNIDWKIKLKSMDNSSLSSEINFIPKNLLSEVERINELSLYTDKTIEKDYYTIYESLINKDSRLRKTLTPHVITRWYRAPEVILLEPIYSSAVDVWSIGCIFAELLSKIKGNKYAGPLFPGNACHPMSPLSIMINERKSIVELSSDDQLLIILKTLGTPPLDELEFITNQDAFDYINKLGYYPGTPLIDLFPSCELSTIRLLTSMLRFDPRYRISVIDALGNAYFDPIREFVKGIVDYSDFYIEKRKKHIFLPFDNDEIELNFDHIRALFLDECDNFKSKIEKDGFDPKEINKEDSSKNII